MAKVNLNINGRKYALGCDAGEEERLMRLGQKLDDRVIRPNRRSALARYGGYYDA